jgi:uncharacterized protein with HEPN domain
MHERDFHALTQMLQYSERAMDLLGDREAAAVLKDARTFFALSYVVQIVGEAASRVSETCRAQLPLIPWRNIIGIRHHLVHGYEDIDATILVSTVRRDLPSLIGLLRSALENKA